MDKRLKNISLRLALRAIADLVMPRVCAVCGRRLLLKEEHICTFCEADMPLCRFESMSHNPMAQAFNACIAASGDETPQPYGYAAALIYYSGDYRRIPQAVKYRRNFALGRYYGALLGRKMAASPLWADVDLVIPVPLHWTRHWRRGYNQAAIIAKGVVRGLTEKASTSDGCAGFISDHKGSETKASLRRDGTVLPAFSVRLRTDILRRRRRTKTQVHLHRSERYANVRTAFVANPTKFAAEIPEPPKTTATLGKLRGGTADGVGGGVERKRDGFRGFWNGAPQKEIRHILLVDDVFTTGATLCACEKALRAALVKALGAKAAAKVRISIATLACVRH